MTVDLTAIEQETERLLGPEGYLLHFWQGAGGERRIYLEGADAPLATYYVTGNPDRNPGALEVHYLHRRPHHDLEAIQAYCHTLAPHFHAIRAQTHRLYTTAWPED